MLEIDVVIVIEAVDAHHLVAGIEQCLRNIGANEACGAGRSPDSGSYGETCLHARIKPCAHGDRMLKMRRAADPWGGGSGMSLRFASGGIEPNRAFP